MRKCGFDETQGRSNFLWELLGKFRLTVGARGVRLAKPSARSSRIGSTFCGREWDWLKFLWSWVGSVRLSMRRQDWFCSRMWDWSNILQEQVEM